MGKDRIWNYFDTAKGEVMAGKSQKSEVRSKKQEKNIASCLLSLFLLFTVHCSLFTVISGCAGHQIIITKDPLKAEEHVKLAQVYEAKGEAELAMKEYKKALEQDKTNPIAYFGLGNISFKNGKFTDAEDYYKMAIEYASAGDQQSAMFYNNLSWIYIETNKDLIEAEKLAQKAALLDPERSFIYLDTIGVIYTKLNEYTKAEDALLSALKNSPDDKTALRHINTHLLELYKITGDKDKLNEVAERLKELGK